MTSILAINTADQACSVTLKHKTEYFHKSEPALNRQAELILPFVDNLLKTAQIGLSELQAIAFSAGPASFTSLRLALSTAQGLAMPHDLPLIPICSLQALAYAFYLQNLSAINNPNQISKILVCTNAYMGQLFWGTFAVNSTEIQTLQPACLVSPEAIPVLDDNDWIGIGNAWPVYEQLSPLLKTQISKHYPDFLPHSAQAVADLAERILNEKIKNDTSPEPIYLRTENAWKKKESTKSRCSVCGCL
jgi:tRNA threonylcarbamoyladenosine biosynthesis protein TsaB